MTKAASITHDPFAGAHNMLVHCGGFQAGDRLLIVHEDPSLGWYDKSIAEVVASSARAIGALPEIVEVGGPDAPPPPALGEKLERSDGVVYLARIGDQDRFAPRTSNKPVIVSYARDVPALASAYGRADHRAFLALKSAIDDLLFGCRTIRISCPLGTEVTGSVDPVFRDTGEVTVRRFPMGVPQPMPATTFEGRVALTRCLIPTGSHSYEPAALMLDGVAFARISGGRITGFDGAPDLVRSIQNHYAHVAGLFEIDPAVVHSWHAGLHPASAFHGRFTDDPDRWSNTIFTSPRFLHFHTCGAYAPGEICWMVLDPTIRLDGRKLWADGRLCVDIFPELEPVLTAWPVLGRLFSMGSQPLGIATFEAGSAPQQMYEILHHE
ncbi:MAG: hypothetical protein AB8B85_17945 [Paracoccaceae bacterium]